MLCIRLGRPASAVCAGIGTAIVLGGVGYLRRVTSPGEPIFVYPSSPLFYVLADRPNPTRYDHLYPGATSPDDLPRVIHALETTGVRVVVTSDAWLYTWGPPRDNQPIEDYLASTFDETARFSAYRVLERRDLSGFLS